MGFEMSEIELRLSDKDPPALDEHKTIYRDVLNLPDPVKLGLTIRYFNNSALTLYFRIEGTGTGYTFTPVNMGSLASGLNAYYNLDQFGSRAKPAAGAFTQGELEEKVTLTLKAYTDAGYSVLYDTFSRDVTLNWIKSDDPAFTEDFLNNFDDGTVQGWVAMSEVGNDGGYPTLAAAADFFLSAPDSLKMTSRRDPSTGELRSRLYKSFATPNKTKVYAIVDVRWNRYSTNTNPKNLTEQIDSAVLLFIGRPYNGVNADYYPMAKWMRFVVPLPANTTVEIRIVPDCYINYTVGIDPFQDSYFWIDDFKIISK